MFKEDFFERVENLSIALVDLDEKEYTELAALLSLLDPLKEEVIDFENGSLLPPLTAICDSIEKLILKDIDPISDPNTIYDSIYLNFEAFKKSANATKNKGILHESGEIEAENLADASLDLSDETDDTPVAPTEVASVEAPEPVVAVPAEPVKAPVVATPPPTPAVIEPDDTDDDLFMDFINEANEYVVTLESLMLDLEQSPGDLGLINEIFRPFHTLKGVSGFMGLNKINHISHEAENILDKARNGKLHILPETSALIFKTIDLIKRILSGLNVKNKVEQATDQEVESIVLQLSSAAAGQPIPGSLEIVPPAATSTSTAAATPVQATGTAPATPATSSAPSPAAAEAPEGGDTGGGGGGADRTVKQQEESVRVKTEKLDILIDMVGELVISYNLFYQDKNIRSIFDHEFQKKKAGLHRVISDLQKASLALRMIPISQTFTKMKRVIRDYTAQHKKSIDLVLHGEETEIDRNMVDSLYEPLMHMIRNSCDHGVESPEDRKAAGKSPKGMITLAAYHKGNTIVIEVKDDGKGLDKEKIFKKAVERGLVRENSQMTDSEIYKLVFLPGFSTMDVVSTVSGRGVGMDVVMQAITLLGGGVDIITEPNKGSTFRIALPLTLAIIEGMLVKVSGELYIIPTANIKRSIKPEGQTLSSVMNKAETVMVEGNLIPIIRLNRKFKFKSQNENLQDNLLIILETNEKVFAIAVDEVLDIQSVVVKTLGEKFQELDGISGATIMGDGKVGLILDVNKLDVEK
ncbi:MAG: chemotaxis protein CheA [Candidatus Cloacimonetes bacterium]|nr:chemotaxis protein CheA [Candidatus Cloacimonadota bacterium]